MTLFGMKFEQRKIFLAKVRFSDSNKFKNRPVIVISNNNFNDKYNEVICCPLTSNPLGEGIIIDSLDLESGRLIRVSKIKSKYPFFLDKNEINKEIGKIKIEIARMIIKDLEELIRIN